MDVNEAREFLSTNHHAVLATTKADGSQQLSPVAVGIDDDGYAIVSTRQSAAKTKNLSRTPMATLCVFTDNFFGPWIQIDGPCEIVPLPQAMDGLIAYYRSIAGEHADWDEYRAAMTSEERVLLRIEMQHVGPKSA